MGKKPKAAAPPPRRAASSSAAAAMLGGAPTGFIGFSAFSQQDTADAELLFAIKRMHKRDPTTKLKALADVRALLKSKSAEQVASIAGQFIYAYGRMFNDNDRRVREQLQHALEAVLAMAGKSSAPHLPRLLLPWLCGQSDPVAEVRVTAVRAFETCFPAAKRTKVVTFCLGKGDVVSALVEHMGTTAASIYASSYGGKSGAAGGKKNKKKSAAAAASEVNAAVLVQERKKAAQNQYERLLATSLRAVARLLELAARDKGNEEHASADTLATLTPVLGHAALWAAARNRSASIRRAWYFLLRTLTQRAPSVVEAHMKEAAGAVLCMFGDREPSVHGEALELYLSFVRRFPAAWDAVQAPREMLPKLYAFLKHACYGSARTSYPCMLPVLAMMPESVLATKKFHAQFFGSMWNGLDAEACLAEDVPLLTSTLCECLLYTALHPGPLDADTVHDVLVDRVRIVATHFLTAPPTVVAMDDVATSLVTMLAKLHRRDALRGVAEAALDVVRDALHGALAGGGGGGGDEDEACGTAVQLATALVRSMHTAEAPFARTWCNELLAAALPAARAAPQSLVQLSVVAAVARTFPLAQLREGEPWLAELLAWLREWSAEGASAPASALLCGVLAAETVAVQERWLRVAAELAELTPGMRVALLRAASTVHSESGAPADALACEALDMCAREAAAQVVAGQADAVALTKLALVHATPAVRVDVLRTLGRAAVDRRTADAVATVVDDVARRGVHEADGAAVAVGMCALYPFVHVSSRAAQLWRTHQRTAPLDTADVRAAVCAHLQTLVACADEARLAEWKSKVLLLAGGAVDVAALSSSLFAAADMAWTPCTALFAAVTVPAWGVGALGDAAVLARWMHQRVCACPSSPHATTTLTPMAWKALGDAHKRVWADMGSDAAAALVAELHARSQRDGGAWSEALVVAMQSAAVQRVWTRAQGCALLERTFGDGTEVYAGAAGVSTAVAVVQGLFAVTAAGEHVATLVDVWARVEAAAEALQPASAAVPAVLRVLAAFVDTANPALAAHAAQVTAYVPMLLHAAHGAAATSEATLAALELLCLVWRVGGTAEAAEAAGEVWAWVENVCADRLAAAAMTLDELTVADAQALTYCVVAVHAALARDDETRMAVQYHVLPHVVALVRAPELHARAAQHMAFARLVRALVSLLASTPGDVVDAEGVGALLPLLDANTTGVQNAVYELLSRTLVEQARERAAETPPSPCGAPALHANHDAEAHHVHPGLLERLRALPTVFGLDHDGLAAQHRHWGAMLTLLLFLDEYGAAGGEERAVRARYVTTDALLFPVLRYLFAFMPERASEQPSTAQVLRVDATRVALTSEQVLTDCAAFVYYRFLQTLPARVREWWQSAGRGVRTSVSRFTAATLTTTLVREEVAAVKQSMRESEQSGGADGGELRVHGYVSSGEVVARYVNGDVTIEMVVEMGAAFPLDAIRVHFRRIAGVSDARARKWLLVMTRMTKSENGHIADALRLWKVNVDRHFEGVEECPICYSVVDYANGTLPRLPCRTCHNKFHASCLYKWFSSSTDSTCPMCRSAWMFA